MENPSAESIQNRKGEGMENLSAEPINKRVDNLTGVVYKIAEIWRSKNWGRKHQGRNGRNAEAAKREERGLFVLLSAALFTALAAAPWARISEEMKIPQIPFKPPTLNAGS
jgi:hypothetical protein